RCQEDAATSVEPTYNIAMRAASTRPPRASAPMMTARAGHLSFETSRRPVPRDATDQSPIVSPSDR
ncbi:uncharacterized protein SCHCODRAFT_02504524, partial [Schizophyllum commune H4-8]|uniref:uncharacterized protein n=1 Tax=Schizophyllum commune (strain H4-8 / FGSC 9210) TaxID=578458 RepID=UPI00215F669A